MAILDTNVILRFLTKDNPEQSPRAAGFFQDIQDSVRTVQLTEAVIVEVEQVLSSKNLYNLDRETIRHGLGSLIQLPCVEVPNKRIYLEALDLYVQFSRLSYVDALCATYARRSDDATVISFDRGYRNLSGVTWEQPQGTATPASTRSTMSSAVRPSASAS
jgi:predicted nucleic-acid-binding protein